MSTLSAASPELQSSVQDIMVTNVHTVTPDTSVADMATLMAQHNLRRVVVVDAQGIVIGVVSQRDTLRTFFFADQGTGSVTTTKVDSLLGNGQPITVTPDVLLVKAAVVLAANKIGCLPVVDRRGKLMGILSVSDLLRHLTGGGSAARGATEKGFTDYTPVTQASEHVPAFIRRVNGELVVPLKGLDGEVTVTDFALLGYDRANGNIRIKFVDNNDKLVDAIKVKRTKDQAVISASGFVAHFDLDVKTSVFDVTPYDKGSGLLLSPRAKSPGQPDDGEELY